jgi:hypothetical protein
MNYSRSAHALRLFVLGSGALEDFAQRGEYLVDLGGLHDQRRGKGEDVAGLADQHPALEALGIHVKAACADLAGDRFQLKSQYQAVITDVDDVWQAAE